MKKMSKNKGQAPHNNCDKADSISTHKGYILARKGMYQSLKQTNESARNCPPKADQPLADNRSCATGQAPYNNCDKTNSILPRCGSKVAVNHKSLISDSPRKLVKNRNRSCATGQVMLLTVILLSGAILASTSLAGLLILYQLRQATDVKGSMRAIFAADSGIEWAFYNETRPAGEQKPYPHPISLDNGARVTVTKVSGDPLPLKAIGQSGRSARAFQANLPPSP